MKKKKRKAKKIKWETLIKGFSPSENEKSKEQLLAMMNSQMVNAYDYIKNAD